MKFFILVLLCFAISDHVSSNTAYFPSRNFDCNLGYSGLRGVCKRFSECQSAQKEWFIERIYPTFCYNNKFDGIVCCLDHESPDSDFLPGQLLIINNGPDGNPDIAELNHPSGHRKKKRPRTQNQSSHRNKNSKLQDSTKPPPELSDCTVVIIEDENNPLGSPCVVPNSGKKNNQLSNPQFDQTDSDPTVSSKPQNFRPVTIEVEEPEFKKPRLRERRPSPQHFPPLYAYLSVLGK